MTWRTAIEYSDSSWNPVRGCKPVSEGCRWCIAARIAGRYAGEGQTYYGVAKLENNLPMWTGTAQFVEKHFYDPLKWTTGKVIMTGFMTDLFYDQVTDQWRDMVFALMALCPQHEFQVVTKRPEGMRDYFAAPDVWERIEKTARLMYFEVNGEHYRSGGKLKGPMRHLWLGVSAEDQATADARLAVLAEVQATVRFVSLEPLLGPVDVRRWLKGRRRLHWVTCGGESGAQALPLHPQWVRDVQKQCEAANVPFFFKQWGSWIPITPETAILPPGCTFTFADRTSMTFCQRPEEKASIDGTMWNQMPDTFLQPLKVKNA